MKSYKESELVSNGLQNFKKGEYQKAQSSFEEVIELNPDNIEAYFHLGNIFHSQGQIGKSIKALSKVLEMNPEHTDAAISLSVIYNDIGKYEKARKIFEKIDLRVRGKMEGGAINDSHINKKFADKHYELAELYLTYNRYDEALFEYNKTIKLDPSNLDARIQQALVYAKKGLKSKAAEELKMIKNEYPHCHQASISLGVIYYKNGQIIEAQHEWQRVLDKDPENSKALMYLNLANSATEATL